MRGPYQRLKYDLRRTFECPACKSQVRAGGERTSVLCRCQTQLEPGERQWMRLLSEGDSRPYVPRLGVVEEATASAD